MAAAASVRNREGLWASSLVHTLRNSLNAMRAHVALLQKFTSSCEVPRVPTQLHRLEQTVMGMESLLKEYLSLTCPEKNEWEEVDVLELVHEILEFTAFDLEQGKITLVKEFSSSIPRAYVDRGKFRRIILDLIVNARQAMPEGGKLIFRVKPSSRGQVQLEICDQGCGIPDEEQSRIFEPFFSTKPEGLGLSLAVDMRIIHEFRGRISFASQVGEGTTFRIVLPTARRQRAALDRAAQRQQWLQPVSGVGRRHDSN